MFKFKGTEKSIFGGAVLLLLVCSYFLYDDSLLFSSQSRSKNELIGSVSDSYNDVRRKNSDNFSWLPASQKDQVYQKDSIFTGDQSKAVIKLKDGSLIEIQPNSLITLNLKDGQMNLDLRYGNMVGELTAGSNITVKSGKEEFKLNGDGSKARIEFAKGRTGNVDLTLLSGTSSSVKKGGQTVAVKPAVKPELIPQFPINKNLAKPDNTQPVEFLWTSRGPIIKYELQISDTADFQNVLKSEETTDQKFSVAGLPEGHYFWRVSAFNAKGEVGARTPAQNFALRYLPAPQIILPAAQAKFNFEIKAPPDQLKVETKVTWEGDKVYARFRFQAAADEAFTQILKDVETPAKESLTPKLPSGSYFVRVRGIEPENNIPSEWSQPVRFDLDLVAAKDEELPAPILVKKSIVYKMPKASDRSPAALKGPVMEWKPVAKVKKYRVQISADREFKGATQYDVDRTQSAWSQVRPGEYYYRVFSLGEAGRISPPSHLGQLLINAEEPILDAIAPIKLRRTAEMPKAPEQDIKISWTPVPEAKSYLVEVAPSDDFSQAARFEFTSTAAAVKVPAPGKYKVRVKALNEESKSISDFSGVQDALYSFANALTPPVPREPFHQTSIFLQQELKPFIWLEWKSVSGATQYRLEVSDNPDFKSPLIATVVGENKFLIKNKIPLGKVFWRVRAEPTEEANESEWSALGEFSVFHKKNETFTK